MKSVVQNVRRLAFLKRTAAIAPALLLPLGMAGVTVRPALELRDARFEEQRLQLLLQHCEQRRQALETFGPLEQVAVFEDLRLRLRGLVPSSLEPIEIYSHLRHAALISGVALGSIRLIEPEDMALAIDDLTVARRPVAVNGEATLDQLVAFVASLDARGLPLSITQLNVGRDRRDQAIFRFDLELGLFHYAPVGSLQSESVDGSTEPAPSGD